VLVDAVTEVTRVAASSIEPPAGALSHHRFLAGTVKRAEKLIILLDVAAVVSQQSLVELAMINRAA
jgi:chemotaxis signal transduction protein